MFDRTGPRLTNPGHFPILKEECHGKGILYTHWVPFESTESYEAAFTQDLHFILPVCNPTVASCTPTLLLPCGSIPPMTVERKLPCLCSSEYSALSALNIYRTLGGERCMRTGFPENPISAGTIFGFEHRLTFTMRASGRLAPVRP